VEASSEIQTAARRVVEENRRLRLLLHQYRVPAEEVTSFLNNDDPAQQGNGGLPASALKSDDVQILEALLSIGRRTCGRSVESPPEARPTGVISRQESMDRSTVGVDSPQESWGPSPQSLQRQIMSQAGRETSSCTPVSSSGSAPQTSNRTSIINEQHLQLQPQLPHQNQTQRRSVQANILPNITMSHEQQVQAIYDFPAQLTPMPNQYQQQQLHQAQFNTAIPTYQPLQQLQRHQIELPSSTGPLYQPAEYITSSQQNPPYAQSIGTNSCVYATDMITAMASDAHPLDVRTDLGCSPQGGTDCVVNNQVVFEVMDRYSGISR